MGLELEKEWEQGDAAVGSWSEKQHPALSWTLACQAQAVVWALLGLSLDGWANIDEETVALPGSLK